MADAILPQALGLCAFAIGASSFLLRDDRQMKLVAGSSGFVWAAHFYLLGAYAGVAVTLLAGLRCFAAAQADLRKLAPVFIVSTLFLGSALANQWPDYLPVAAGVLGATAMFYLRGVAMRLTLLMGTLLWLTHNAWYGSIGGVLGDSLIGATNLLTIWRMTRARYAPAT